MVGACTAAWCLIGGSGVGPHHYELMWKPKIRNLGQASYFTFHSGSCSYIKKF